MSPDQIQSALADITAESDPTLKHLKLAGLVSTIFREREIELVVVGGSAIEFYTEGAYMSGDIDLCVDRSKGLVTSLLRQELMGALGAEGGPRSWVIGGVYVDILGALENFGDSGVRRIRSPFGEVRISPVEEILVERVLISIYPKEYPPARECAIKLLAALLQDEVEVDWDEVQKLAQSPSYNNWNEVKRLVDEQAQALQVRSPYDSEE